jgi:tetratricopeptide (TPR) repeat protein
MMRRSLAAVIVVASILSGPLAADQRDPRLDSLFAQVQATRDAGEAARLDRMIWTIWLESGDGETDRLLAEGILAMSSREWPTALTALGRVIERRPDFAEGWNKRATLFYLLDRYDESARDVERTLTLEPRHYGALSGMGLIELQRQHPAEALEWFNKALAVNPNLEGIREMAEELEIKVKGKPI